MSSKNLTLLFSACFLISAYYNFELVSERESLEIDQAQAESELVAQQEVLRSLAGAAANRSAHAPIGPLEDELVAFVLAAKSGLPQQMITMTTFTVGRANTASKGVPLTAIFTPVQQSNGLRSTSIKISAKYQSLKLMQHYLTKLKDHPVVLSAFVVKKDSFDATFQLIGK